MICLVQSPYHCRYCTVIELGLCSYSPLEAGLWMTNRSVRQKRAALPAAALSPSSSPRPPSAEAVTAASDMHAGLRPGCDAASKEDEPRLHRALACTPIALHRPCKAMTAPEEKTQHNKTQQGGEVRCAAHAGHRHCPHGAKELCSDA